MDDSATWGLPPIRRGYPASAELNRRRAQARGTEPADGSVEDAVIGGVRCLIVEATQHKATVLYFHGGGYRLGSPFAYVGHARRIAQAAGVRLVMPFYRLAPEHPFPAALYDAVAVYRELRKSAPVVVAGDSAGGGLAAGLCVASRQAGNPLAGAIFISPMLDLAATNATFDSRASQDQLFSRQTVLDCAALYLQGSPVDDPMASPLHADPVCFPPALVMVGGTEVLLGDAIAFTKRLALADQDVTLHVAAAMGHVWPLLAPATRAADAALAIMTDFIRARVCSEF